MTKKPGRGLRRRSSGRAQGPRRARGHGPRVDTLGIPNTHKVTAVPLSAPTRAARTARLARPRVVCGRIRAVTQSPACQAKAPHTVTRLGCHQCVPGKSQQEENSGLWMLKAVLSTHDYCHGPRRQARVQDRPFCEGEGQQRSTSRAGRSAWRSRLTGTRKVRKVQEAPQRPTR